LKFTFEKINKRIKELEPYRYMNREEIKNLKIHEDKTKKEKYPPENISQEATELKVNELWEGRDKYFWIMGEIDVPRVNDDENFVLLFDFGKSSEGNTSCFEAMLYINGEPYQAVDGNHKEVFIDKEFADTKIEVSLRLWGGLEGGGPAGEIWHHTKYADQAVLSQSVDDLYYTALVMLETIEILDENDSNKIKLLNILDDSFKQIDWSQTGNNEFYSSLVKANDNLQKAVDALEKHSDITVSIIGHTHIDVMWLWRLKHTREKTARSFSTVFRLMEQYPEYIFLQTQPQLYEYIKEDYPEFYEKIKEKVKEGRWEIEGGMWLESDANIPSGESLVRQLLFGSRFIKEEFDQDTKYLWLPDVFGYSWALPQILKKSGIDMFMTTKISWSQFNRMPNDTFYWKGIDGTEILTHFITTPTAGDSDEFSFYTYNGEINPFTVKGVYDNYRDKDLNDNLLIAYGYGDGGGGVNREQLEKARRIEKLPGLPNIKHNKAGEYFKELQETIKEAKDSGKYVHTWDGELYLELHRGTYTSQARNKMWNRKLELAYREAEIVWSWIYKMKNGNYPQDELNKGWKAILRNQFHDTLPGSSIKEVYEDSEAEYEETKTIVDNQFDKVNNHVQTDSNEWTILNSAAWKRDELIELDNINMEDNVFEDSNGNILDTVSVNDKVYIDVKDIPALGSKTIKRVSKSVEKQTNNELFEILDNGIETPFYNIKWDEKGHLVSIFDKDNDREVISSEGFGNVIQLFEDKPLDWDAWDIDIFYQEKGKDIPFKVIDVKETNELFATVVFEASFGTSSLKQEMRLYRDNRRIDFKTTVDWKERQQLLKVKFDVDVRTTEATYDIQYGNAKRPTHWNTSWDMAKFETVGHQWADLSESDYGVSLLNDSKYGYDIKDGTMRLSLLKGAIFPDETADIGEHEFIYSLYPHTGDFVDGRTVPEAWSLNTQVTVLDGVFDQESFFNVESAHPVMIDTIKKSEDGEGLIVRLHDYTGGRQKITLKPTFEYNTWQEVNLMEKPMTAQNTLNNGPIKLNIKPYEVKTLLIQ